MNPLHRDLDDWLFKDDGVTLANILRGLAFVLTLGVGLAIVVWANVWVISR